MRPEEKIVLDVLVAELGGFYEECEKDPPDAYLHLPDETISVEVTQVMEPSSHGNSVASSRLEHDSTAIVIANRIISDYSGRLSENESLLLRFRTPINDVRQAESELRHELDTIFNTDRTETLAAPLQIEVNEFIDIFFNKPQSGVPVNQKIEYFVVNDGVSEDIGENVKFALEEIIRKKEPRRKKQAEKESDREASEYWLALFSDIMLASKNSYDVAFNAISLEHNFDKIYVVLPGNQLHELFSKYSKTTQEIGKG